MKRLASLVAVLAMAGSLSAFPLGAPSPVQNAGYGGKPYKGIEGTVGQMSGSKFELVTTMPGSKEGATKTFIVTCDNNTKFLSGGQPVSPSTLKSGIHVAVMGGQNGNMLMANTVNIGGDAKRK